MAKKPYKGLYYLNLKTGLDDTNIHDTILTGGDSDFIDSEAGKRTLQRLMQEYGLTQSEAIAAMMGYGG